MKDFVRITRALSDPTRVRAVMLLCDGELCLCQLIEILGLAPSTVSRHLAILKRAGLVISRKEGHWRYYRLAGRGARRVVGSALGWLKRSLVNDRRVALDRKHREQVTRLSKEDLCQCYHL